MFSVTKVFEFESAHALDETCTEKCKQIHGHTYKLEVTVVAEKLIDSMVIDFTTLKERVQKHIIQVFDHKFMCSEFFYDKHGSSLRQITNERSLRLLPRQPTAEYMCYYIFEVLKHHIEGLAKIRLWETTNSYAEYSEEEHNEHDL